mmetsp:Transcript_77325/g.107471  ORF Transcript_77325/g.107471 Transcript_77325/m.107471 type:complete len:165 (-) Transcript_77325:232-726(-)
MVDSKKKISEICEKFVETADDERVTKQELAQISEAISDAHLSNDDTNTLIAALFSQTCNSLSDSNDVKKVKCLKKVVLHIVDAYFEKKGGVTESLFFPSDNSERRLIQHLNSAKTSMDVCVFTISNNKLANALSNAHKRGVKVRIISDDECAKNKGADIFDLAD